MTTSCIVFLGCKTKQGYGLKQYKGKVRLAHRIAYCEANNVDIDELPRTTVVRHTCDNPACHNPEHLIVGTQSDNCRDRSVRAQRGEKRKLTPEQVLHIRTLEPEGKGRKAVARAIGLIFGVDESTVRCIWTRKYWGYL